LKPIEKVTVRPPRFPAGERNGLKQGLAWQSGGARSRHGEPSRWRVSFAGGSGFSGRKLSNEARGERHRRWREVSVPATRE